MTSTTEASAPITTPPTTTMTPGVVETPVMDGDTPESHAARHIAAMEAAGMAVAPRKGQTVAEDLIMRFADMGARLVETQRAFDGAMGEVERLTADLAVASAQLAAANEALATNTERMEAIAAAEADGQALIYIAPDCVPWLRGVVNEAKHGYTTAQQFAAAVSIAAQCDAITNT